MPQSNFPNGFVAGLNVRGMPLLQTNPGNVFWVGNGSTNSSALIPGTTGGVNGNKGTFVRPFATLQAAVDACQANTGDIIFVKPGHSENIDTATVLVLSKAGVSIIGLGTGTVRPRLVFTAAAGSVPVTAANISIQNFLFLANFADVASAFTVTGTSLATDFNIENCEFRDTLSSLNFITLVTGNATSGSLSGFRFAGNRVTSLGTTAATTAIKILSTTTRLQIVNNFGVSAVLNDTPAILDASTFQLTGFELGNNRWERPNTSSTGGSFIAGSGNAWTGLAYDNYFYQVDNTAGIWISTGHGSAFGYINNFSPITGAVDKSALINPAAV